MARKLKSLGLVLQSPPESGGANHYETALAQMLKSICSENDVALTIFAPKEFESPSNIQEIKGERKDVIKLAVMQWIPKRITELFRRRISTAFSKQAESLGIDAIYFASPNRLAVDRTLPQVITTVWDIGHRDLPLLPEMSSRGRWLLREFYYRYSLKNSRFVVTDCSATSSKLEKIYGVPENKIFSIGLLPLNHELPNGSRLIPGKYFIYPAQKWRHKNHRTILKSFKQVLEKDATLKLVFTGSDKGEGKKIHREISALGLETNVLDLGFVTKEDLVNLQFHANALLMPSRLGPTNIPPLDAINLGTLAIVSDAHKFDDEIQNLLTVVPAKNPNLWAKAMLEALNKEGPARFEHSSTKAELTLTEMLESLSLDQ